MGTTNIAIAIEAMDLIRRGGRYPTEEQKTGQNIADCKRFVEMAVTQAGKRIAYRGSNDMIRNLCVNVKAFDSDCPIGALVFMVRHDGQEPNRYKPGGEGYKLNFANCNAHHVGIYLGKGWIAESAQSIGHWEVTKQEKRKFSHYGLIPDVEYLADEKDCVGKEVADYFSKRAYTERETHIKESRNAYAFVSNNGKFVNLRKSADLGSEILAQMQDGEPLQVLANKANRWSKVIYNGIVGYMRTSMYKYGAPENSVLALDNAAAEDDVASNADWGEFDDKTNISPNAYDTEQLLQEIQELKERVSVLENMLGMGVG